METSEAALDNALHASQRGDVAAASKLVGEALRMRRTWCHPLSVARYHAEKAETGLALQRGDFRSARECGRHSLLFLEASLAHCQWHPSLSVERMQQACIEALLDHRHVARSLMRESACCNFDGGAAVGLAAVASATQAAQPLATGTIYRAPVKAGALCASADSAASASPP